MWCLSSDKADPPGAVTVQLLACCSACLAHAPFTQQHTPVHTCVQGPARGATAHAPCRAHRSPPDHGFDLALGSYSPVSSPLPSPASACSPHPSAEPPSHCPLPCPSTLHTHTGHGRASAPIAPQSPLCLEGIRLLPPSP